MIILHTTSHTRKHFENIGLILLLSAISIGSKAKTKTKTRIEINE
jgi:hypothetical protein